MKNKRIISTPKISTLLPGSKTKELHERKMRSFLKTYASRQIDLFANRGFGPLIEDVDGNIFLNFSSSINAVGEGHPKVVAAIRDQVTRLIGGSGTPFIECAEKLKSMLPGELREGKIGYTTTGSEAIDLMTRMARDYTKRRIIIGFHGTHFGEGTSDCSRLAGDSGHMYKGGITPLISEIFFAPWPYCYRCPLGHSHETCSLNCLAYFQEIFETFSSENVAGIITEGLPANSGVLVPPPGYLQGLRALCKDNGIMLLVDEVFSGFGKTGKMLAVENWGIVPDLVSLGKSMGGGLPISAVATKTDVIDKCGSIARGTVGSFSGNVVSCAAAIATMEIIQEERLLEKASTLGSYIKQRLEEMAEKYDIIGDVRGVGLMLGVELVKDRKTKSPATEQAIKIQEQVYKGGVLIGRYGRYGYGNVLRMTPYLETTQEQADLVLNILEKAFRSHP
jgi:4-aminobutyrate aminotransferase/(S)-3-amino-2-methylpropionate transaminase